MGGEGGLAQAASAGVAAAAILREEGSSVMVVRVRGDSWPGLRM
jgi:hypothetical protein